MSLSKMIPISNLTVALTGGDAEVLRDWTESLSRSQAMLTESSGRDAIEFQIYREIEARLTRRCAELEAEVARNSVYRQESEAVEKCRLLEAALRASQEESAILRKICDADKQIHTLAEEEEKSAAEREARLTERENNLELLIAQRTATVEEQSSRLRRYAEALNQEKEWIRTTAGQMEDEVRNASTLHPLRDYLALTEKEVVRVEIDLKRTPTSSPNRAGLEEVFGQLVAQREFLRGIMNASEQEAAARADRLTQIRLDGRSAPVPPHPEKIRTSSKV
jgi:hypothetical protein